MSDDFEFGHDAFNNSTLVRINHDYLVSHVSQSAVMDIMAEEIRKQLSSDPELRILVAEMVKQAIASMNLQEVVALAVSKHLNP